MDETIRAIMMVDQCCAIREKPCKRGYIAKFEAMTVERRKNSFEVARHGVFQSEVVFRYPLNNPGTASTTTLKQGEERRNITRYRGTAEPERLTQNCHFDIDC